jgi:5-methyltetrahydropteroyltriglutamate--homocysteine methyltransferase
VVRNYEFTIPFSVTAKVTARACPGVDEFRYASARAERPVKVTGVTLAMHVCKGNGTQSWIASGGYDEFSKHVFTRASGFDIFHLEYDDERSGSFEPLANLPDDKVAVLGLVSTKWTALESADDLKRRVDEAAQFHPKEQLALATQCGFASANETAQDRLITEETQRDKLRLVADVARDIWE